MAMKLQLLYEALRILLELRNGQVTKISGFTILKKSNPRLIFEDNKMDVFVHTVTEYGHGEGAISKILEPNLILPIRLIELGIEYKTAYFINTDSYFNKVGSAYSNLLNYSLSKKSLLVWLRQPSSRISVVNLTLEQIYRPWDSRSKFVENLFMKSLSSVHCESTLLMAIRNVMSFMLTKLLRLSSS